MNVTFDFDSPMDFTTYVYEPAGPLQAILSNQNPTKKRGDVIMIHPQKVITWKNE
jgi:hypothetical protein